MRGWGEGTQERKGPVFGGGEQLPWQTTAQPPQGLAWDIPPAPNLAQSWFPRGASGAGEGGRSPALPVSPIMGPRQAWYRTGEWVVVTHISSASFQAAECCFPRVLVPQLYGLENPLAGYQPPLADSLRVSFPVPTCKRGFTL